MLVNWSYWIIGDISFTERHLIKTLGIHFLMADGAYMHLALTLERLMWSFWTWETEFNYKLPMEITNHHSVVKVRILWFSLNSKFQISRKITWNDPSFTCFYLILRCPSLHREHGETEINKLIVEGYLSSLWWWSRNLLSGKTCNVQIVNRVLHYSIRHVIRKKFFMVTKSQLGK